MLIATIEERDEGTVAEIYANGQGSEPVISVTVLRDDVPAMKKLTDGVISFDSNGTLHFADVDPEAAFSPLLGKMLDFSDMRWTLSLVYVSGSCSQIAQWLREGKKPEAVPRFAAVLVAPELV